MWSLTTTGLPQTLRGAWTLCCLWTHALHQHRSPGSIQGCPRQGLAWKQHPTPRSLQNLSFCSCWGRSRPGPSRWGTGGLCTPASASGWASLGGELPSREAAHSHATRFPFLPLAVCAEPQTSAGGRPCFWATPRSQGLHVHLMSGPPTPHGRWTARTSLRCLSRGRLVSWLPRQQ